MSREKPVIRNEEIEKLKVQATKGLNYATQQAVFWNKKMEQLKGSLAICNMILKEKIEDKKKK